MRHQVKRWAGIQAGWVPAYGGRPRTRKQAELFARLCNALNGDRFTYKVKTLPIELPFFV
jgi:hypothetical protein